MPILGFGTGMGTKRYESIAVDTDDPTQLTCLLTNAKASAQKLYELDGDTSMLQSIIAISESSTPRSDQCGRRQMQD